MNKQQLRKELYRQIDAFTGNREIHTPVLVNDLVKLFEKYSERKTFKQLVDDCFSKQQWSSKKPTMKVYLKARKIFY